jgi:hypothetical protein
MQAVQFLLASHERLNSQNSNGEAEETTLQQVDPVQVSCYLSITDSSCLCSQKKKKMQTLELFAYKMGWVRIYCIMVDLLVWQMVLENLQYFY